MALVGAGRVATTLGVLLARAGHRIVVATGGEASRARLLAHLPTVPLVALEEAGPAVHEASVVVLGTPDDAVARACGALADRGAIGEGQWVLHLSGALGLDALVPAEEARAEVLSLHPLQAFPDVEEGLLRFPGSGVAVTALAERAYELGERLARDAGGRPFRLDDQVKPLYHAAAVFCSNYLVAVEGMAEELFRLAGLGDPLPLMAPLSTASLESSLSRGPRGALTGPAARGDVGTVARNLGALAEHAPEAVESYVALARQAARLALEGGRLDRERFARLEGVLARWR